MIFPPKKGIRISLDMDGPSEEKMARLLTALGVKARPIVHVAGDPREGLFDRVQEALNNVTEGTPIIIIDSFSALCSPTKEKGPYVRPAAENRHTHEEETGQGWQTLLRR